VAGVFEQTVLAHFLVETDPADAERLSGCRSFIVVCSQHLFQNLSLGIRDAFRK
jgi:hypothetical protein